MSDLKTRFYNGTNNVQGNKFPTSSILNGLMFGAVITLTFAAFSSFGKINVYSTIIGHSVLVCALIMAIVSKSNAYSSPTFKSVFIASFPL